MSHPGCRVSLIMKNARRYHTIDGYVWCDRHGCIHDDTTDPYDYGEPDCRREDHRPVAILATAEEMG